MQRTLFLIDGMTLAFRAFYALYQRPRINSQGVNTSSVYGFTLTLMKLITDHELQHAVVVLDAGEKTFRNEMYSEYKANRDAPPEGIISNLPLIRDVVESLDLPVMAVPGVEADDVIGTLARKVEADGHRAVIVSSDKDFQQLLSPSVTMYKPRSRGAGFDHITADSFTEEFALEPVQFIDVLALMGDSSDNVPGVKGIGVKTAVKLLKGYGTLENLLERAAEIKAKRAREGLLANADMARLSKRLVTIKLDVDVPLDWDAAQCASLESKKVHAALRKLEFNSMLERLGADAAPTKIDVAKAAIVERRFDPAQANYRPVTSRRALVALEARLARQERLGWCAAHSGGPPIWAKWSGLAVAWASETACYIPLPLPDGTSEKEVLQLLAPLFTNPNMEHVGHGIKPLLVLLAHRDITVAGSVFDTEVAHYLLDPDRNHSFAFVAKEQLRYIAGQNTLLLDLAGEDQGAQEAPSMDTIAPMCEQAALALELQVTLSKELNGRKLDQVAHKIEFPLVHCLAQMERAGIVVDAEVLRATGAQMEEEIDRLEREIFAEAGREFTIGSSKQVRELLFDEMGLPVRQKTPKGLPSTAERALIELSMEHAICGMILDWRKARVITGTFVAGLQRWIRSDTRRIHTVFNQASAASGRLSSSDPGLQNIPIRKATGRELRRAFIAEDSWQILSADYSQIELRILAHMSKDPMLIAFFLEGRDPHTETAARIHGVDPGEVTREQRDKAKAVNYGIPYGLSATGLAQQLRCSTKEAQELMRLHRESFMGVHRFLSEQVEKARARKYAETLWGRKRYLPDLDARNRVVRSAAERIAVNMPIQGTQADMIKLAMVNIQRQVRHRGLRTRLLLQVHDELVFEVPDYEAEEVSVLVREEMTGALPLDLPVEVNLSLGANWLEAH